MRLFSALCFLLLSCENLPTTTESHTKEFQGFTLASWSATEMARPQAAIELSRMAALGATHVSILTTAYMPSTSSNIINWQDVRTPTHSSIAACVAMAQSQGLKTVLKPQLQAANASWSAEISPSDVDSWFESYGNYIYPLAMLANDLEVDMFIIGTELSGTVAHHDHWSQLIDSTRTLFDGEITYAASWDAVMHVPFWHELDYIGVDAYFPVTNRTEAGRTEMLAGWQPWLNWLERIHSELGKDIIFTEIGYRSIDGAGMQPHEFGTYSPPDYQEQADLYWAALEVSKETDWILGMLWWNWLASGDDDAGLDYSPASKPAEDVLRSAWGTP